jgi:hypothetical protein
MRPKMGRNYEREVRQKETNENVRCAQTLKGLNACFTAFAITLSKANFRTA